jgi:hypothetical protein
VISPVGRNDKLGEFGSLKFYENDIDSSTIS